MKQRFSAASRDMDSLETDWIPLLFSLVDQHVVDADGIGMCWKKPDDAGCAEHTLSEQCE